MKKITGLALLFAVFALAACKKDTYLNDYNSSSKSVVYQFTATKAGNYNFQGSTDSIPFSETANNTATWTKTVVVQKPFGMQNATVTAYPPADWTASGNEEADVTLKIFINNVEMASGSAHFTYIDRPAGLTVSTTY